MKQRSLLVLVAVTAVAVVAAFLALDRDTGAKARSDAPEVLFPDLVTEVNDAAVLEVSNEGQTATLALDGETWVCREAGGYRASFDKVRKALVALARLEIVERMTADPEQHARLGVEGDGAARAVLRDPSGQVLADVVLGDTQYARSGQMLYVRRTDEDQVWRCKADLTLSADPLNWVEREVLRLESSRASRIEITHADGETVTATRPFPAAPNWEVAGVPADRSLKSPGIANGMGTALSYLSFDEVRPAEELALGEHHAATGRFATYGGLAVEVRVARIDDQSWITLDVGYEAPPEPVGPAPPEDGEGDAEPPDAPPEPPDAARQAELASEAAELDARLEGWAYRIPQYKADLFLRRMEDLLAAPPEATVAPPTPSDATGAAVPVPEPGDPGTMAEDPAAPADGPLRAPAEGGAPEPTPGGEAESGAATDGGGDAAGSAPGEAGGDAAEDGADDPTAGG